MNKHTKGASATEVDQPFTSLDDLRAAPPKGLVLHAYGDSLGLLGARDSLRASGLIPPGTPFPDECKAPRGVRWRNSEQRRFVLSKGDGTADHFRLVVHALPEEKRARANKRRVDQEVKEIDRELRALDLTETEFRAQLERHILLGWTACQNDLQQGHAWAYAPGIAHAIEEKVDEIRTLLRVGAVTRRPEQVNALKNRKAALQDASLQKMLAHIKSGVRM
ncbi:hypothetical protein [Hydrogenophaga luteola]|uniref:Uncharacterized protein n=1 Tax=Hydrogenophaga luteola TaxID=1591122 RepID=A0ABV7W9H4_9BURK